MPAAKITTRASNANKQPGVVDQKKKRKSPAEMATQRALDKSVQDAKAAAKLAAPLKVAGVEDSMAAADEIHGQNAARPIPVDITRAARPLRRTCAFANLEEDDHMDTAQKGQLLF